MTSLFNIGREHYESYSRSQNQYLAHFALGIGSLDADIIVYADKHSAYLVEELINSGELVANVKIFPLEFSDLPFSKDKDKIQKCLEGAPMRFYSLRDSLPSILSSIHFPINLAVKRSQGVRDKIWKELAIRRPKAPEYLEWRYLVVTWAKPYILNLAYEQNLIRGNEQAIYVDFGLGHGSPRLNKLLKGRKVQRHKLRNGEVLLLVREAQSKPENPWDIAENVRDDLTPAALFQSDKIGAEVLANFFVRRIERYFEQGLVLDDQSLLSLFRSENAKIVQTIEVGDENEMVETGLANLLS